jgi:hypothetical protein
MLEKLLAATMDYETVIPITSTPSKEGTANDLPTGIKATNLGLELTEGEETMSNIVWQSTVTEEMITALNDNEVSLLVEALNEAVMEVCNNYEVGE